MAKNTQIKASKLRDIALVVQSGGWSTGDVVAPYISKDLYNKLYFHASERPLTLSASQIYELARGITYMANEMGWAIQMLPRQRRRKAERRGFKDSY